MAFGVMEARPEWTVPNSMKLDSKNIHFNGEHFCAPVIHPTTGKLITKYTELAKDEEMQEVWTTAFGKEWGSLAQGDNKTGAIGTNSLFVMTHDEIKQIPKDRTITYGRIVVDYRSQKADPNRVRITAGGNLIDYPGELTTRSADLTTSKILWNSVLSTKRARYMCLDIKNFYLCAPLERYEYMRMKLTDFPDHIVQQYDLARKAKNGFVYIEIRRSIYGLPQSGRLANDFLREKLRPKGYYEVSHTPGLWKHVSRPIQFTLVVDDFGVKYSRKEDIDHLIQSLKKDFTLSEDWKGDLYCGISLKWDYEERTLDISMPGYIQKALQRYKHERSPRRQDAPYPAAPRIYGAAAQAPSPDDDSPEATEGEIKHIQQVVGTILYYARAVDITVLMALSTIASEQATATKTTIKNMQQMLDYLAWHPDATIRFVASEMVLNIHSDASYLSAKGAKSRAAGHFFLGAVPIDGKPIFLNGAIFTLSTILKMVAASAAEAELGALFMNIKEGRIIRLTLAEMGHPQPPTPIHVDNTTAVGIANDTIKKQRSRSFEMRYFYASDQVKAGNFDVQHHPGAENMGDYPSKHFHAPHHRNVRPLYQHEANSPRYLPRAMTPKDLKGCVGNKVGRYVRGHVMPIIPGYRSPVPRVTRVARAG